MGLETVHPEEINGTADTDICTLKKGLKLTSKRTYPVCKLVMKSRWFPSLKADTLKKLGGRLSLEFWLEATVYLITSWPEAVACTSGWPARRPVIMIRAMERDEEELKERVDRAAPEEARRVGRSAEAMADMLE